MLFRRLLLRPFSSAREEQIEVGKQLKFKKLSTDQVVGLCTVAQGTK
jgi:hypothetical protein